MAGAASIAGGLFSLLGNGISAFAGLKQAQGQIISESLKVVNDMNATAQARDLAAARVLVAEAQSSSWLTRTWRPLFMVTFMAMLLSYWFGYVPDVILTNKEMPPILREIFDIIKLGIMGYIPSRGLENIVEKFKIGSVLSKFVEKKLA